MSAAGRLSAGLGDLGLRNYDSHECSQLNEMKIDMSGLNMVAGWHAAGDIIMM